MALYIISYDLSNPGRDYESLSNALKSYGNWWHQSGSTWIISIQTQNVATIRDYLTQFIDLNDKIFIAKLSGAWAASGFTKEEYDWIKSINV